MTIFIFRILGWFHLLTNLILSKFINKANKKLNTLSFDLVKSCRAPRGRASTFNLFCYKSFNSGNNRLINVNKAKHTKPHRNNATETPNTCAKPPATKPPKGTIPAKVIIKTLIILPRNSSGTVI